MVRTFVLLLCVSAVAAAQDNNKITVPLSSPSQPATLKVHLITGSITVTAGSGSQVTIESESRRERGPRREDRNIPPGMHRIDGGGYGFTAEEDHNTVTVAQDFAGTGGGGVNLTIQTPVNTSVQLSTINGGHIDVSGLNGNLDVQNTNGSITLMNVSGAVSANTLNGALTVSLDKVTPDKPMSFASMNGKVDVTLPADTKAKLRFKTSFGAVYSDFDVKTEPDTSTPVVEDSRGRGGRYRIRMDRSFVGSINGGGPEYSFQTMNGSILIHKK